jgi:glycosyltransferase involved in cell wall biosynthesis
MKLRFVAYQLPLEEGSAPGRALYALCTGLIGDGHDVEVWSWGPGDRTASVPPWCTWRPLPAEPAIVTRLRALWRPRSDIERAGWRPPDGAIAVADDVPSFGAVARSSRSIVTLHYWTRLDSRALRRLRAWDVQSMRADARVARRAALVAAYSKRVARAAGRRAVAVPIAYSIPDESCPAVEAPVAALLADWQWLPNRVALGALLRAWPEVRARVPGARLLLAGRALETTGVGGGDGVELVGHISRVADVLARAAVIAFPCPDTSGPKVKVIEALSYGVPVVTTPAGAEGISETGGVVVTEPRRFARTLADVLDDPARRAALGEAGRRAAVLTHAPIPAARARVEAIRAAFDLVD